ncbi:MAG: hydrolase [Desulfuromonas sp.]|nr:MAG: hydrolase [Desulfuromonas sp.]
MDDKAIELLKELVEAPSPSGYEQPAQRVFRKHVEPVVDSLQTDVMGNVIGRVNAASADAAKLMLAGHCDEIGFMVKYIDENGFLFFAPIGGVDAHLVPGQRVNVHTATGPVRGVVGKKPIHLMDPKERESVVKFKDQFIDIGCSDKKMAEKLVAIGDPVTFSVGLERLQGERVTSRAFDDKMGAWVVARVLQEVSKKTPPVHFYGVSTVQEEIGLRGATTSAFGIDPDIGIAVDVTFSSDTPGLNMMEIGELELGKGPIIARGANINPTLFDLLVTTAKEEAIPYQVSGMPRATGTDANVIQLARSGVAAGLIGVPLRYMHSPSEVLSLADLENTVRLLVGLIYRIESKNMFIPN